MKTYSKQERIDMVLVIGECQENCFLASRVYAQKYPTRKRPNEAVFRRLLQTFRRTGNVSYEKVRRTKHVTGNEENKFRVLTSIVENSHVSQRKIASQTDVSRSSTQRILKIHKFHPFRIQMHQELFEIDFVRRVEFCLWCLDKLAEEDDFFDYVLFSDESTFHNNGLVNRHNFHYYSDQNPHAFRTLDHQYRWSVNVWGGILGQYVIGPYFFEGHLNGQEFNRFLAEDLFDLLEDVPLVVIRRMWLQLDGAPAHFHINVRNHLNQYFPNKWIGRGGPQNWPARSPDLTSPDFFLWSYIKSMVYDVPPTTSDDMKQRIRAAFATVTPQMLVNVGHSLQKRVQLCIENDGKYFKQLL